MSPRLTETETSCIINELFNPKSMDICRIRMEDGKTYELVEIDRR